MTQERQLRKARKGSLQRRWALRCVKHTFLWAAGPHLVVKQWLLDVLINVIAFLSRTLVIWFLICFHLSAFFCLFDAAVVNCCPNEKTELFIQLQVLF